MESVKKESLKGAKWSAIENLSVQGMRFILGIIMARLLTPGDYGVIGMITIFIVISETFIDSGFSQALVRQKDSSNADFSTVFYFNVIIAIFAYVILFLISPFVADFFHAPIITSVLRVLSLTIIINYFMAFYVARMTIKLDFKALSLRSLISSILSGIAGVIMAYYNFGVWSLVFQTIASSFINLIFIGIYCKWLPKLEFSKDSFHRLFKYGRNMLLVNIINRIYTNITSIVIGKFYNATDLGLYDRGISLASFPVNTFNGIISKITLPILAKIQDENERLINAYRKYITLASLLTCFGCCLVAALARPIILLLFTEKWVDSIIFLQIYAFAIMFEPITTINLILLQVKGRSDLFLRLELIKKTISLAILFASIPFGVIGICISKVIYTQIAIFLNTYDTGKLFGIGYWSQFKDFIPFLLTSIIVCIPSFFISYMNLPYIIRILIGTIVAFSIYFLIMRKNNAMLELKSLIFNRNKNVATI